MSRSILGFLDGKSEENGVKTDRYLVSPMELYYSNHLNVLCSNEIKLSTTLNKDFYFSHEDKKGGPNCGCMKATKENIASRLYNRNRRYGGIFKPIMERKEVKPEEKRIVEYHKKECCIIS